MTAVETEISKFMRGLKRRNTHEVEFHQAVEELVESVMPWYLDQKKLRDQQILERLTEPDRIISFRVTWEKDSGEIRTNRGWRVQFNNSLGPYKGGLRFHPSVNQSILKFLGFEQIFKNSLTDLPMGGAKGGSNFDPKGRSESEIMRFCQSFMMELHRYIGEDVDVPAGDIGVGAKEISNLFGQYKRLENRWAGVLTGKGSTFGGSAVRKEATGYGCVYFCEHVLNHVGEDISKKTALVSGSGNVALYTAEKALQKGIKVLTMSDSSGFVHFEDGLSEEQLKFIIDLKENKKGRILEVTDKFSDATFYQDKSPWGLKADIAFPCATQNEIQERDAKDLVKNGVFLVCEGANMPVTSEAARILKTGKVIHIPGKASNAGGVAVSGLEQTQNAMHKGWSREKVDTELQSIMKSIHGKCQEFAGSEDQIDYVRAANLAGFEKIANTLSSYGIV